MNNAEWDEMIRLRTAELQSGLRRLQRRNAIIGIGYAVTAAIGGILVFATLVAIVAMYWYMAMVSG